jgi:hypothetical protein
MSQVTREECIELGLSLPTAPLTGWANEQLIVAKGRAERLKRRGITAPYLKEIKNLIDAIGDLQIALGKEKVALLPEVTQAQRVREEGLAYWQEAKQILKIEFGNRPEIQAKCRLGVRTGRLIGNLCREIECVVAVLREHAPQLGWLGVDEAFLTKGDAVVGKLKESQAKLASLCRNLSPALAEQCFQKGNLYDLCRKLVRIGQLEFLHEPEQSAAFNYTLLRKELRAGSEIRSKAIAR